MEYRKSIEKRHPLAEGRSAEYNKTEMLKGGREDEQD